MAAAKKEVLLVAGEAIQWHRHTSTHDKCPRCGGPVGFLSRYRRCCMSTGPDACDGGGLVFELRAEASVWLRSLGFNDEETERLLRRDATMRGRRAIREVAPGEVPADDPDHQRGARGGGDE